MANRVTEAEVKEIISTTQTVSPFIDVANALVEEKLSGKSSLSTAHLKEIERWLAAHFLACSLDRQLLSEKVGTTSITYMRVSGKGLMATTYGQQAVALDTTGTLANLGKRRARLDTIEAIDIT